MICANIDHYVNTLSIIKKEKKKKRLMRNISKHHFPGGGLLLSSIMDIHCSTAEGGADQNRMAIDVRGRAIEIFVFAEVINE